MKKCFKCQEGKNKSDFYSHRQMKDGLLNKCKSCTIADTKMAGDKYDKTEKGVIRVIYKTQKRNNRLRGFGDVPYSKAELSEWLYKNKFKILYNDWVLSRFLKNKKPSVDRLEDFKGYSMDNIRLGTWFENHRKQVNDVLNGTGTSGKRCKPVIKKDKQGEVIAVFVSYSSAVRDMGYSLENKIKTKKPCRNGFYWQYQ